MPFKVGALGKVKVTGKAEAWLGRLGQWRKDDFPGRDRPSLELYLGYIVSYATGMVKRQWQAAGRAGDVRELAVIETAWHLGSPAGKRLAMYDALDYLAEHMSWDEALPVLLKGRDFANDELRS